ncbi:MAG: DNA translocase FtsK [Bacillota bacterium]
MGEESKRERSGEPQSEFSKELVGLLCLAAALFSFLVIRSGKGGAIGTLLVRGIDFMAGEGAYLVSVALGALGLIYMFGREARPVRVSGAVLLTLTALGILSLSLPDGRELELGRIGLGGGYLGALLVWALRRGFGAGGATVGLLTIGVLGGMMITNTPPSRLVKGLVKSLFLVFRGLRVGYLTLLDLFYEEVEETEATNSMPVRATTDSTIAPVVLEPPPQTVAEAPPSRADRSSVAPPARRMSRRSGEYQLPPLSLLQTGGRVRSLQAARDAASRSRQLEEALASYGVAAIVVDVVAGPTVTRYEVQPGPGVKISKIASLADDLALKLAASGVRIEAPIPGKSVVGIEVPNSEVSVVYLRDCLETAEFRRAESRLTVALGKDIAGRPVITSLDKTIHLLIAGATGSGKSVCLNTIITSILFKATPDEVKFLMIDPKMVELATYNGIPHLIAPVVTDPKKAAISLKWVVHEVGHRYALFVKAGVREIAKYNEAVAAGLVEDGKRLPHVVVIIDELADLMMVAPVDVEDAIQRLAQTARAAGVHLVVATQRPSVDVITGTIKANIPSRIAFAVSSQVDSRTIFDVHGAEKLVGRGDMLFSPVGSSKPIRAQGAFITEREVEEIVEYCRVQAAPEYEQGVFDIQTAVAEDEEEEEMDDELLPRALRIVLETGQASVSMLQRRLKIGYTRAGRLVDIMEDRGYVGPHEGSKARQVLITWDVYNRLYGEEE